MKKELLYLNIGLLLLGALLAFFIFLFPGYREMRDLQKVVRKSELSVKMQEKELAEAQAEVAAEKKQASDVNLLRQFVVESGFQLIPEEKPNLVHFKGNFSAVEHFLDEVKVGLPIVLMEITPTEEYPEVEVLMEIGEL